VFEWENEARDAGEKKTSATYSCKIQFVCGEVTSAEIHRKIGRLSQSGRVYFLGSKEIKEAQGSTILKGS